MAGMVLLRLMELMEQHTPLFGLFFCHHEAFKQTTECLLKIFLSYFSTFWNSAHSLTSHFVVFFFYRFISLSQPLCCFFSFPTSISYQEVIFIKVSFVSRQQGCHMWLQCVLACTANGWVHESRLMNFVWVCIHEPGHAGRLHWSVLMLLWLLLPHWQPSRSNDLVREMKDELCFFWTAGGTVIKLIFRLTRLMELSISYRGRFCHFRGLRQTQPLHISSSPPFSILIHRKKKLVPLCLLDSINILYYIKCHLFFVILFYFEIFTFTFAVNFTWWET